MIYLQKSHLLRIPWWMDIIIAAILYLALNYWVPTLHTEIPWLEAFQHVCQGMAPIASIAFLLLGAKALYDFPEKNDPPQEKRDT